MLCSQASLVNPGIHAFRAVTLKCRSWGCPNCVDDRSRQLAALAKSGQPTTFITLTVNPNTGHRPADRARSLARAWPIVVRRACKKYGYKSIPYLCVFEATKRGEPHLHILCRVRWIDHRWLSAQLRELIGAPITDIRQVTSAKKAAAYISKYVGKEPHRFPSCKRYWSTRSWGIETPSQEPEATMWSDRWYTLNNSLPGLRAVWERRGFHVVMEGRMLVATRDQPETPVHGGS